MSTARDFLAAVQQRADDPRAKYHHKPCSAPVCGSRHCQTARDRDVLVAALTAALDLHNAYVSCGNPQHTNFEVGCPECAEYCEACGEVWPCPTLAVITDALAPKENDSMSKRDHKHTPSGWDGAHETCRCGAGAGDRINPRTGWRCSTFSEWEEDA